MKKILLIGLFLFIGCISPQEKQRRHELILHLTNEMSTMIADTSHPMTGCGKTMTEETRLGNIQFVNQWLIDLKARGYK
jgi:uncharacterized protein YcfL